jgi:hypothetical protein
MAPPVDHFRQHDSGREGKADDHERVRTIPALRARPRAELRRRRRKRRHFPGAAVRRGLASNSRADQAGFQLPEERGILGERLREFGLQPALCGRARSEIVQAIRCPLDCLVERFHFLLGGSSPVAMRQIFDALRLATIVAAAPRPA